MPELTVSYADAGADEPIETNEVQPVLNKVELQPKVNPANEPVKKEELKVKEEPKAEAKGITIPDELRFKTDKLTGQKKEKGWISKVLDEKGNVSIEKLVQQIDTLESLKGQKTVAFDWNNAKPEEIEEHLAKTRPESHEVYDFVKGNVAEGTEEAIQKLFHGASLPKPVANMLLNNYLNIEKQQMAIATSQEGFDAELKESFGDDYKTVATKAGTALKSVLSPDDVALLESVPNVYLGLIYRGVSKLINDYAIDETAIGNTNAVGNRSPVTLAKLQEESKKAFDEIQALDRKPHTDAQKQDAIKRYRESQKNIFNFKGAK